MQSRLTGSRRVCRARQDNQRLQPSNLIIVGGRTSMGKTSFALNIALHAPFTRTPGAHLQPRDEQHGDCGRFVVGQARIDSSRYKMALSSGGVGEGVNAAGLLSEAPIYLVDMGDITIMEMRTIARQLMAKEKIGLIIVDYIQLLYGAGPTDAGTRAAPRKSPRSPVTSR